MNEPRKPMPHFKNKMIQEVALLFPLPICIAGMRRILNEKRIVAFVIHIVVLFGLSNIAYSQKDPSPATQNWHIPDLENAPVDVTIETNYSEVSDTISIRGTKYTIRVPQNWNGTLISDLDYVQSADSPRNLYLLEQGYALSGTQRRPERLFNYDPAHEIHDIISVFDIFETTFGKPKNIIQIGCSGGGTITLAMAEIHPDRIDGAIAGCGATSPWMANTHLDGLFVLQALIAPELPIADLPLENPEIGEIEAKWIEAIKKAQLTPEGRARIALAITIGQWPAWGARGKPPVPQPDANDAQALQESMYLSLLTLLPSKVTFGTGMLEQAGRGQLKWNTGVDYKEFYENGNKLYKKAVEKLYKDAGLSLNDELEKINAFPRIKSDANAIKYWSVPGRTHIGEPKVPHLRIHTSGDGLVYPSMAQGYEELVIEKGYSDLFRIAYVNSWGHCSFSLAEWMSAIKTVEQRIETGLWPETDPETLNKLGKKLDPGSESRYYDYKPVKKYNRAWCPSVNDFNGTQD